MKKKLLELAKRAKGGDGDAEMKVQDILASEGLEIIDQLNACEKENEGLRKRVKELEAWSKDAEGNCLLCRGRKGLHKTRCPAGGPQNS